MLKYKFFGRSGLRVSEICLGTMSMGQDWPFGADEPTSHDILSAYRDRGGNFLDTADKYHNGQTEEFIGRWLGAERHKMVVATKYTLSMDHADPNASGNQRKHMMHAVEESLRRLNTDYIDLLWVHAYDKDTPIDETMRGLDDLIRQGKVTYIGMSDAPAWVISAANTMAELRGWTQFVGIQAEYNLLTRDLERDLIPMSHHFDLGVTAWAPLAGGVLTGKYTRAVENDSQRKAGNEQRGRDSEASLAVACEVDNIADDLGVSSTQVAIAWVLAQGYRLFPIAGARKVTQIEDTMAATDVTLPSDAMARLDELTQIKLGFPHEFLASDHLADFIRGEVARHQLRDRPLK